MTMHDIAALPIATPLWGLVSEIEPVNNVRTIAQVKTTPSTMCVYVWVK